MTSAHTRAARREREAARILGAERTRYRARYQTAADMTAVRLPSGDLLQAECKTRARLPRWIVDGLRQAARYTPGAVALLVVSERGGAPIAILSLHELARLLDLQPPEPGQQLALGGAAQN